MVFLILIKVMAKVVFVPPYGEDLQLSVVDGCIEVSSDINVLLNLAKKVSDVHEAENILARVRELPKVGDESVDLSSNSGADIVTGKQIGRAHV